MTGPVSQIFYPARGGGADRALMVMLPGVGMKDSEFAAHGLAGAARERGYDVIAAQPALDLYLDGDVAAALHDAVIAPALVRGYARIWLLGISLGGMGALLYASRHEALLEGLVLLAPFLGTQGTIAEIEAAGGLAAWRAEGSAATVGERRLLNWLQEAAPRRPARPRIYLGYGRADRFAAGHAPLGRDLPPECVTVAAGGHDWDTWATLWRQVLNALPCLAAAPAPAP